MAITRKQYDKLIALLNDDLSRDLKIYLKVNRLINSEKFAYDTMTDPYILKVCGDVIYLSNEHQIRFESVLISKSFKELRYKFYVVRQL